MPKHQTTRERVHELSVPGGEHRLARTHPPGASTKPRRRSRQGTQTNSPAPRPASVCGGRSILVVLFTTTLGNGYLGSRIDEERSEMRYLV